MKTRSLLKKLSQFYPKKIAMKYKDYPGLQLGKLKENTNTILVCLDFDEEVYEIMDKNNLFEEVDLIITHHPFIYGKLQKVLQNDQNKEALYNKILQKNIPICSYHTNFDEGKDGMNDALANALELLDIHPLNLIPMARGGHLKRAMNVEDFAHYANEKLNVEYSVLISKGKQTVQSVAIVGGGGWYDYKAAQEEGYDIFISGDVPHHGRRGVISYKYNYLDMPHEIERIFIDAMSNKLNEIDSSLKIIKINHEKLPKLIIK